MKKKILALLEEHKDNYLSGEEVSRILAVSRTAIWKHIQALRQLGYTIESHTRLGYKLHQRTHRLLPEEIHSVLQTRVLGRNAVHYDDVDSTSRVAKELAIAGCPEGTVVIAESQHQGRGRLTRSWFAPASQGIWFSLVLRPSLRPHEASKFTLLAAVALWRAFQRVPGVTCGIKWPNDILWSGKKLVGILTEMSAEMDRINYIVMGIGINVNINATEFPPELQEVAASLSQAAGGEVSRRDLLAVVLEEMERLYDVVNQNGFDPILEEWRKGSITLGSWVEVRDLDRTYIGKALDIDSDGALLVDVDGVRQRVIAGDVSIRPAGKNKELDV